MEPNRLISVAWPLVFDVDVVSSPSRCEVEGEARSSRHWGLCSIAEVWSRSYMCYPLSEWTVYFLLALMPGPHGPFQINWLCFVLAKHYCRSVLCQNLSFGHWRLLTFTAPESSELAEYSWRKILFHASLRVLSCNWKEADRLLLSFVRKAASLQFNHTLPTLYQLYTNLISVSYPYQSIYLNSCWCIVGRFKSNAEHADWF